MAETPDRALLLKVHSAALAAAVDLGTASARRLDRVDDDAWTYAPVVEWPVKFPGGMRWTSRRTIEDMAFSSREEAIDAAQRVIDDTRLELEKQLREACEQAAREQHERPKEIG